jgi:hypothetical protein
VKFTGMREHAPVNFPVPPRPLAFHRERPDAKRENRRGLCKIHLAFRRSGTLSATRYLPKAFPQHTPESIGCRDINDGARIFELATRDQYHERSLLTAVAPGERPSCSLIEGGADLVRR